MSNCVTDLQKKSAEYKAAMERFNISSGELEMILHEYQNTPENAEKFQKGELAFPSDSYIQGKLYGPAGVVYNEEAMHIYEEKFSKPIVVATREEALDIKSKASSFFEIESIRLRETRDGKWQVLVTKPTLAEMKPVEEAEPKKSKVQTLNEQFAERQKKLSQQLEAVYGIDALFSGEEFGQIAQDIVFEIGDILTEVQYNPEASAKYNPTLKADDVRGLSRSEIFAKLGVQNVVDYIRDTYFDATNNENIDFDDLDKVDAIHENMDAFITKGAPLLMQLEGFSITNDYMVTNEVDQTNTELDPNNTDDSDAIQEVEGSLQEHWQMESRTENVFDKASILVKQALSQCYKLNPDGSPVVSKWGIKQRMDAREATQSILRWTQGALSLSSMVSKLELQANQNKWVQPIIDRLKDTSGKESSFQSQFFGVFSKYFQLYSVGKKENGTLSVFEVNTHPALSEAKRGISGQYNAGVHPLFDSNGRVNKTALGQLKGIWESLKDKQYTTASSQEYAEALSSASTLLGYPISVEAMLEVLSPSTFKQMTQRSLQFIVQSLENNADNTAWQPFSGKKDANGIINNIGKFITPITDRMEDAINTSFYDSGNMYQSYVTPSYVTKLVQKFSKLSKEDFAKFMQEEYGQFRQFKDANGNWRNSWLALMDTREGARDILTHKVQLTFAGNKYMKNRGGAKAMSDAELTLSIISEYFAENGHNTKNELAPAWFRIPLMSNKPSSEFIKFYSYRGADYKARVLNGCMQLFGQEISRIQTVKERLRVFGEGAPELIKNFDGKRGKQFCFFDFLNTVDNAQFHSLVKKVTENQATDIEKAELATLARDLIQQGIEAEWRTQLEAWRESGVLEAAKSLTGIEETLVDSDLENFFWNDFLASNNILNLTVTDLAFYKDTEDVQKRLAQLHAPGIRANVEARDFRGNRVADSKTRTLYLRDIEISPDAIKSNIIDNVKVVFANKLKTLTPGTAQYKAAEVAYQSIIESFEEGINIADAQGYASPTSYRKKALLFGKWDAHAEEIYQKLKNNDYTYTDIQTAFQPLKPFVYTQVGKDSGVDNAALPTIKMGVQNKNSEYLLMMAGAITQNEETGLPNYLRAIYEIMEESAEGTTKDGYHIPRVDGIDTVQFESTVKAGLTGRINLLDAETTADAKQLLEDLIYEDKGSHKYDLTYVQELNMEDYCIQQEVPEHFRDHAQQQGSQIRMITVSDLNPNMTYEVEGRKLSANDFRREYEQTIADNIRESIALLEEEFFLNSSNLAERNTALARALQEEILSSPRYGLDLLMSCMLDENGNFKLPLGDPIQSKRIEQLINSIVKNRVNKQKIAGGPIVQVSNFGTSRQLNIRFKGKDGSTLETLADYLAKGETEESWKKYIEENQAGIAYYEAFVPSYTQDLFEKFMDSKGNIDVEAIEAIDPDLLKMIGYRIPSEDKYSMAPIKVVGFMPKEAGDGIMLPYEITLITGSDFDIDKFYLMRKEIPIIKTKNGYKSRPYTEGRQYRNNKIVDMTWEVLTHEDSADKVLNPGGFEEQKKEGYLVQAMRLTGKPLSELEGKKTSELKSICSTNKNLAFIGTHTQFYKQNAAAGSILAIFAVAKTAHACLEGNRFTVDADAVCKLDPEATYNIMGLTLKGLVELDPQKDIEGNFIGKTLGSLVASAADAVKDPVLNLMNINNDTVNILNTLVRMGLPFRKASRLLSTKVVSDLLTRYNTEKLSGVTSFNKVLDAMLTDISAANNNLEESSIITEDLSDEDVNAAILNRNTNTDYKILLALKRISAINTAMTSLNFATRFNSIASAVGPLIIDNLKIQHNLDNFSEGIYYEDRPATFADVFELHPILDKFADSVDLAKRLFGNHMPTYSAQFENALNYLEGTALQRTFYRDRRAFSKFNDFYQSYLLVANGVLASDKATITHYLRDFPAEFAKQNYKEKYAGNPFIESIRFDIDSESKAPVIKINVTGLDNETKSRLTSGWLDLYKSGEEGRRLAANLFRYCFYKGGIGFNPKTFMSLLPVQLKMRLKGYKETFAKLPELSEVDLINQFIRNNWNDDSIVPYRKFEKPLQIHDGGYVDMYGEEFDKMKGLIAFKTRIGQNTALFIRTEIDSNKKIIVFREAAPLGNNGEFTEISMVAPVNSTFERPAVPKVTAEIGEQTEDVTSTEVAEETTVINPTEQDARKLALEMREKYLDESTKKILSNWMGYNTESGFNQMKSLIKQRLQQRGIKFNEQQVEEIAKTFC